LAPYFATGNAMVTTLNKRRAALAATAILSVAGAISITTAALNCRAQVSENFQNVKPIPADHFIDSLGINTHVNFTGAEFSGYGNTTTIKNALEFINVKHIRDGGLYLDDAGINKLADILVGSQVKISFELGSGGAPNVDGIRATLHKLLQLAPGRISAIEGPNEINNLFQADNWRVTYNGKTTNMCTRDFAPVVALQKDLYQQVKADPVLKNLPVYNFSMVYLDVSSPLSGCRTDYTADLKSVGKPTEVADYDNVHDYPFQGAPPRRSLKVALHRQRPRSDLPAVLTETGYSTGEGKNAQPPLAVDEDAQARYILDAVLDSYTLGAKRTFIYELMDDSPDTPLSNLEKHYGVFRADGTPKPAAIGLHNLTAILGQPSIGGAAPPPPISYSLMSAGVDGYEPREMQLLLYRADGSYVLALWAEPRIWDRWKRQQTSPRKASKIKVGFARIFDQVLVYDPLQSSDPIAAKKRTSSVSIELSDHPVMVVFK